MRQAEEDFNEGRITEEEFEARERYYEELYASGGNIEKSSEGFSTEGGAPKFVRKIGEKLGFSVSEIDKDDIQKEYEKNVDAVLNGTYNSSDPLIIGRTPEALERIGLAALPVTITSNHVYSIAKTEAEAKADNQYNKGVNYHGLGADVVKNIMSEISNPIMIVISPDSAKSNNRQRNSAHRIIVIVELSLDNKKVIAPIEIDAEVSINQTQIDSNHVVSYYDKNNVKSLVEETFAQENIGKTAIYYGNKKRIEDFVKPLGLQLPARFKNITDSNTIIRNVNNNVNRKIENVTQSQQFKRWFGDWQNDPKSASKVVNADGTPKVMYHGTRSENGEFWEFNYNKSKKKGGMGFKTFGQGNYFTSQRLDGSELYGPRVIEAYLNIKNPFELTMGDGLDFRQKVSKSLNINTAQMTYSAIQKVMKDAGYDGVILYEQNGEIAIAVTFDSTQIKSATDNIGTFDTSNPDIRYSVSENDTESPTTDAYSELDSKAKRHLNGVEKTIGRAFAQTHNLDIKDDNGREDAAKLKKVIEEAVRPGLLLQSYTSLRININSI